jgi:putative transposase
MKTSVEEIPEELWQVACAREAVIRPLAAAPRVGRLEIEAAATALSIRRAYVYRLLAAYRRRSQTSTLVLKHWGRPQEGACARSEG